MDIKYYDKSKGYISEIESNGVRVPFYEGIGPSLYYKENNEKKRIILNEESGKYFAKEKDVEFSVEHIVSNEALTLRVVIKNLSDKDFAPEAIGLSLGINSYMVEYPQWNDKFFPSYLRCEKTHFIGYFMSPQNKIAAVICDSPVAAWELEYNKLGADDDETCHFGHRIYTGDLLLVLNEDLPKRYPNLKCINAHEERKWDVNIVPLDDIKKFRDTAWKKFNIPMLEFKQYTLAKGETAKLSVFTNENYSVEVESPCGKLSRCESFTVDEYGVYTVTVTTESGKVSEAKVYCRHDYGWYLQAARKNAVYKPQKATTHTESWYGHFSSFLAKKHYPDDKLDAKAKANFDEIMPLMYDFEKGEIIIFPKRVQNTACLVSLLVDLYESDKKHNEKYLDYANNMAEDLIKRQSEDGAYRNGKGHYTSVIYIAKSMLELALCEKELAQNNEIYSKRYEKHYNSAKKAVLDLKNLGEKIGTEGEHTLEDGMITCSALQLAYFALTLNEDERLPFTEAAEHLMNVHRCLEELETPDCRTRGATLRFWEAQYDVMIRGNMMNTPHGWTSWKTYATYYLYLLTGKEEYLKDTIDTMGACIQMIDENENLRWAFIKDPCSKVKVLVPDLEKPIKDGYISVPDDIKQAYRGRYEVKTVVEGYVDLISDWYRIGEQKVTGGYKICSLIYDDHSEMVDNQGGACDNDVHEHFKCLEETLLKKVFVIVNEQGIKGYNCFVQNGDVINVIPYGECEYLHTNTDKDAVIRINGKEIKVKKGLNMLKL